MIHENLLGDPHSKLWLIMSCPKLADKTGPMSSSTGQTFISYLHNSGYTRSNVRFEYIVNEIPHRGGMEAFKERPGFLENKIAVLKEKIQKYKPNLILCVGAEAMTFLTDQKGILKWRGHIVWNEELQTKIMCTFEPYHAWKQTRVEKKHKPGQYDFLMRNDIRKAIEESETHGLNFAQPNHIVRPKYADVIRELDRIEKEAKILSFDIEILKPYTGHMMDCIGLSMDLTSAISIPFWIPTQEDEAIPYWKNEHEFIEILRRIKRILESPIPKVAQNGQFDITVLAAYYNIHVQNIVWDTMVVAHELYCDLPKDLGTLISLYTNLPYHKHMIHSASMLDRWEYNAADAVANIHVMEGQKREMCDLENRPHNQWNKTNYYNHYITITNPCINTCNRMHLDGVLIDEDLRLYVTNRETAILNMIEDIVDYIFPVQLDPKKGAVHKFNIQSTQQKKALFYDIFNVPPIYLDKNITANVEAMQQLMNSPNEVVAILAELFYEYRMADARLGKFKIEPDEGLIRTKYDVCGTDTGRLASGENKEEDEAMKMTKNPILPAETNLQNIQKGPARKMLIPRKGEKFAIADLYSAEAFLVALDSGEFNLLETLKKGIKIYQVMLEETTKLFSSEVQHANYDYHKAKQTIHACNYGVEPHKMSMESGLPRRVSEWQYDRYHSQYPGIKDRMTKIRNEVNTTRWLSSSLGRRRYFVQPGGYELNNAAYAWPSQSCIGEITKIAMNKLYHISCRHELGDDSLPWCMPNLNTHDGLAIRVLEGDEERATVCIKYAFEIDITIYNTTINIPIEIGWGINFNDMVDEKVYFYEEQK